MVHVDGDERLEARQGRLLRRDLAAARRYRHRRRGDASRRSRRCSSPARTCAPSCSPIPPVMYRMLQSVSRRLDIAPTGAAERTHARPGRRSVGAGSGHPFPPGRLRRRRRRQRSRRPADELLPLPPRHRPRGHLAPIPAPGGMFRRFPFFQRLLSWTKPHAQLPHDLARPTSATTGTA